jgi:hypothetical protein
MNSFDEARVESAAMNDFLRVMEADAYGQTRSATGELPSPHRLNIDPENVKNGLGQLVLTLVKLLNELLERQAIRRMESGYLCNDEIERLGFTLMRQAEEIERLRELFGLEEEDLNLDLGPFGKLL